MSSWCQEIKTSLEDNSTWNASIVMPSSVWSMTDFPLSEDELKIADLCVLTHPEGQISLTGCI